MPPYTSSRMAVLNALIEGQRKRLINEAKWRQEDPLSAPSLEPADPTPPPTLATQPRPEPQLNLPTMSDVWQRMQEEKHKSGVINLYRMGQAAQAGVFGPRGLATTGGAGVGRLPGHGLGATAGASPSIDPAFLADHHGFTQAVGDGRLSPDELAQVHGVTTGVNAHGLGWQPGPIGGEGHQAAADDLGQAADRLARSSPRVATALLAYGAAHDAAARRIRGGAVTKFAPKAVPHVVAAQAPPRASMNRGNSTAPAKMSPVPFRLKDGSTIPDPHSRTGVLMQPPTVDLGNNAEEAKSWWGITASSHMARKFRRGGEWDYQRIYGAGGRINRDYINIGNYNYGAVSAAAGYTLDEAQAAAGLVNLTGRGAKSMTYYGGNPRNAEWIAKGWRDYSNGRIR